MNKVLVLIVAGIMVTALFLYFSNDPEISGQSADTKLPQENSVTPAKRNEAAATQPDATENQQDAQSIEPDASYAAENSATPIPERLVEARLEGITFLQRRALRGDQTALETLRRLIKTGNASFRMEAVELISRSADPKIQQEVMTLLEKPILSDDDVDSALLMIIGTFEDIEAALALEEPIDPSKIRRRGQ